MTSAWAFPLLESFSAVAVGFSERGISSCRRRQIQNFSFRVAKQMDSFSSPSGGSSSQFSTEDFKDQLKTQLAQAYAEEFLETVRGKCFDKCITKPGSSLSGSESSCISRCVERYIEATGIISKALFSAPR